MSWIKRIKQDNGRLSVFLLVLFLPYVLYIAVALLAFDPVEANNFMMDRLAISAAAFALECLAGLVIIAVAIRALIARESRAFAVAALLVALPLSYHFGSYSLRLLELHGYKTAGSEWDGQPAPPFAVATLDGQTLSTEDLRGKWVLFNHWATWCGPCVKEIPDLMEFRREHAQEVVLIGYSVEEAGVVRKHIERTGYDYPFVALSQAEFEALGEPYNRAALPTTYFISPDGKFSRIKFGMVSPEEIRAAVRLK